eukprot:scaffold25495_cov121-Isochrysis_galbana.AAC.6
MQDRPFDEARLVTPADWAALEDDEVLLGKARRPQCMRYSVRGTAVGCLPDALPSMPQPASCRNDASDGARDECSVRRDEKARAGGKKGGGGQQAHRGGADEGSSTTRFKDPG